MMNVQERLAENGLFSGTELPVLDSHIFSHYPRGCGNSLSVSSDGWP
jgi:hypothetical protein